MRRASASRRGRSRLVLALIVVMLVVGASVLALGGGAASRGVVLFDGDFARGLAPWSGQIHPERIAIVNDPILGARRKVARMTVSDSDVGPTPNPRAQLESSVTLAASRTYWIGWSTMFPRNFPRLPGDGWLTFESVYGPPNQGAGPLGLRVTGDQLRLQRNATYGYDVAWQRPLVRGRWLDFAMRIRLSRDPAVGFAELYLDDGSGWKQQTLLGKARLQFQTLDASNGVGPNRLHINNYRRSGMAGVVTLYQAAPRIGTTFDVVKPGSHLG